jgi:hypothetical protein
VIFQVVPAQLVVALVEVSVEVSVAVLVLVLVLVLVQGPQLVELPQGLLERQGQLERPRVQQVLLRVEPRPGASSFRKDHLLLVLQLRWLGLA